MKNSWHHIYILSLLYINVLCVSYRSQISVIFAWQKGIFYGSKSIHIFFYLTLFLCEKTIESTVMTMKLEEQATDMAEEKMMSITMSLKFLVGWTSKLKKFKYDKLERIFIKLCVFESL